MVGKPAIAVLKKIIFPNQPEDVNVEQPQEIQFEGDYEIPQPILEIQEPPSPLPDDLEAAVFYHEQLEPIPNQPEDINVEQPQEIQFEGDYEIPQPIWEFQEPLSPLPEELEQAVFHLREFMREENQFLHELLEQMPQPEDKDVLASVHQKDENIELRKPETSGRLNKWNKHTKELNNINKTMEETKININKAEGQIKDWEQLIVLLQVRKRKLIELYVNRNKEEDLVERIRKRAKLN